MTLVKSIDTDIDADTNIIMISIEVLISSFLVPTSIQYLSRPHFKSAAYIDADVNDFSQKYWY